MFTDHQKKALDVHRHLSVTANAGAGKTAVLVERFLDILLHTDARIHEVVAMTFTEKAASELRKKIADTIEESIRVSSETEQRRKLEGLRGNLASAVIGTIHSFCAQILREYPVEADVDSAFTILEGVDQYILMQEALRETFESVLRDENVATDKEEFLTIVRMFGRGTVQKYISLLLNKREQVERMLTGVFSEGRTDDEILRQWKEMLRVELQHALDNPQWRTSLQHLLAAAKGKTAPNVERLLRQWSEALTLDKKIECYVSIASEVFTLKNELRKTFIGSGATPPNIGGEEEKLASFHAPIKELIVHAGTDGSFTGNRSLLKCARIFLKLFTDCLSSYEAKKSEFGHLDFEDLQLKTHRLLQREDVRRKLQEKYKYMMVDEFQDTNRLQYEILALLVGGFTTGNLFIVGDPKQSIYGFRSAEVEVFEETKSDILQSSSTDRPFRWKDLELSSTEEERKGSISLTESFRLLSHVAAFVNKIFANTMNDKMSRFDVRYDELVKARTSEEQGDVELLFIPETNESLDDNEDGESNETVVVKESRMIARHIVELSKAQHRTSDKAGSSVNFAFGDIAILLRKRTHIRAIEQALLEYNVPYVLSGGIGYYQTQEILDFYSYFKFLLSPEDDVALVGILRSPFFALSDVELYEISSVKNAISFWEKVQRHARGPQATDHVRYAVGILHQDLEQVGRTPIPFLVHRIFRQTGWHGTVSGLAQGRQHAANIQKLLRLARDFEGKGFVTLYDFVERLRALIDEEDREGQAPVEKANDAVNVMTIHAAKGLEFPIVILPFTHEKFRYDHQPYIDSEIGIGLKTKNEANYDEEVISPLYLYMHQRSRQKTEAEEKRVFYVACTRARDRLILSGRPDQKAKHVSYLSWVMESLELETGDLHAGQQMFPGKLKTLEQHGQGYRTTEIDHTLAVDIRLLQTGSLFRPLKNLVPKTEPRTKEMFVEPLQGQTWGQFFSATHIKTYLECPTKYYLKYHLGLPEQNSAPYDFDENEEPNDRLRGELIGTFVHAALQRLLTPSIAEDELERVVASVVASEAFTSGDSREVILQQVLAYVKNFVQSSFGREVLSAPEMKTEFSLSMMFERDFLTGTIDRLYKDQSGSWHIIDYKTDYVREESKQSRAELYKPQLAMYAMLISQFTGQERVRASVVFLRHPDAPVHFHFGKAEIDAFSIQVQQIITNIKSQNFNRAEMQCTTCSYIKGDKCIIPSNSADISLKRENSKQLL